MATFSYSDAVKLLGAKESKILNALDNTLGGALLSGSVFGALELLGWFDAKADFIRMSKELVAKASEKRLGMSRSDRTDRLHAAHSIIVLVAFFEAFDELGIPFTTKTLDLTKTRQLDALVGRPRTILHAKVPVLTPGQSYERFLITLGRWYEELSMGLARLVTGLSIWDDLTGTQREHHLEVMRDNLSPRAVRRYEELLRQLSIDCPEVALWTIHLAAQATSSEIRQVGLALSRLEQSLAPITIGNPPGDQRAELALKYNSALEHPILESGDAPGSLAIPSLKDSYIDPFFQVTEAGSETSFARRSWWDSQPLWADLHRFLAGFLTSPKALSAPMLVLGDPGSGKSVLTKVLAARLPASDFLVVRVQLRSAPAEAEIIQQIEHGLKEALKEEVSWPSLVRSAGQALPVVLLDGFDELLQATGVNQSDYLAKVARFQRDRADVGHPVAIIVTSRISVADRAVAPPETVVLRLAPFVPQQTSRWLEVWRENNSQYFETSGLRPLDSATAQRYPELSEQPLLLLMLALYDADGNALQQAGEQIYKSDLYERLLTRFAHREVVKEGDHRTRPELAEAVASELERLSIVALAMFNRGAQWVSEEDLDKDLAALAACPQSRDGMRSPLSPGTTVLGRFFFVQRAEAVRDLKTLRTYEFLHATFGEYLVARHIWNVLTDLPNRVSRRSDSVDDSELYALLSFALLPTRWSIIVFLQEMADRVESEPRSTLGRLTAILFRAADQAHLRQGFTAYTPALLSMPQRYAMYCANLVVVATILDRTLSIGELSGEPDKAVSAWRSYIHLWKSLLSQTNWNLLMRAFLLERSWTGRQRDVRLQFHWDGLAAIPLLDVEWSRGSRIESREMTEFGERLSYHAREIHFMCDAEQDFMLDALTPVESAVPDMHMAARGESGDWVTVARAVLGFLFSDPSMTYDRQDYLHVLGVVHHDNDASIRRSEVVFAALRSRPHDFHIRGLAHHEWISQDPRFWSLVCGLLGKGNDDADLVSVLTEHWDINTACGLIPEDVLDAWLRMAEREAEPDPSLHDLVASGLLDLDALARTRPDLIKRARNALREQGHEWVSP